MSGNGVGYPVAQLAHVEILTPKPEETLPVHLPAGL